MVDISNKEPSKLWPVLKQLAKAVKIPGTELTLGSLAEIQDDLAADEAQKKTREALDAFLAGLDELLVHVRKVDENVTLEMLKSAGRELSEDAYCRYLARKFLYSDFKGIEQMEKLVPLELDDVFVDLKMRRETSGVRDEREAVLHEQLQAKGAERDLAEASLSEIDVLRLRERRTDGTAESVDQLLAGPGGAVVLGGPGSGKTTLTKRLARSLALGPEAAEERYPAMPWCFPVVLPMSVFDANAEGRTLEAYLRVHLAELGGRALADAFGDRFDAGEVLVLLDGLDEVADAGRRVACSRAAGRFVQDCGKNRVLVTSRPVGYSICRLSVPCVHAILEPFSEKDVETFARRWYVAYDKAVRPKSPDPEAAGQAADDLLANVRDNPRVASLATNPLMLTIIALIKQQNVVLPERRVELYEIALNTLIRSWNKARSLADRPVGRDLGAEDTKKVWAAVAHWMHSEKSTGTCHRQQLQQKLVDVLTGFGRVDELEAEATAESYIQAAAETAGLLEERGSNVFAFMHQTFQEYLAARHLILQRPWTKAIERVLEVTGDPRWREIVRLAAGFVGVVQGNDEMASDLVEAILEQGKDDPLEPWLCTSLRLAASCVADDVRVAPEVASEVVVRVCERALALPYETGQFGLAECLESMRSYRPDARAVEALLDLTKHSGWKPRMEAVRMLRWEVGKETRVAEVLRGLLKDSDHDVRAHAALGLWRAGERGLSLTQKIAHGLTSNTAKMPPVIGLGLESSMIQLLEDQFASVRLSAASVLGQWGASSEAMPAMLKLLEDEDASVRWGAASVLGQWGASSEAMSAMSKHLEDESVSVRSRAASVLGQWGASSEARPAMLKLLEDESATVRFRAAEALGQWGASSEAISAMLKHLEDEDASVRSRAAEALGQWGASSEARPAMLKLLEDEDASVRSRAASVLGQWGSLSETTPAMLKLLEDEDASVRLSAASVLGQWGSLSEAMPAMLKLLEDENAYVRSRAASVLGQWRDDEGSRRAIIEELVDNSEPAIEYLGLRRPDKPDARTTDLLISILTPRESEPAGLQGRREVVFKWLWESSEEAEEVASG